MSIRTLVTILAVVIVFALSANAHAGATSGEVSIDSASAAVGNSVSVDLTANVQDPGLAAWTIDVSYDEQVLNVTDCSPFEGGVCNIGFAADEIRLSGASASGIEGESLLAQFTFDCANDGVSSLDISLDVFADATLGDPQPIDATVSGGEIACVSGVPCQQDPLGNAIDAELPFSRHDLIVCPEIPDVYFFTPSSGSTVQIGAAFESSADIDLVLFDVATEELLATSEGTTNQESIAFPSPDGGELALFVVLIEGPSSGALYQLNIASTGGITCADFTHQEDAQAAFDADSSGNASLDGDGDGIACEELPKKPAALPDAGSGPLSGAAASPSALFMAGLLGAGLAWLTVTGGVLSAKAWARAHQAGVPGWLRMKRLG